MLLIKKQRYKPLYKKFLKLRHNVQNRQKILKFKKQKWKQFLTSLKKRFNRRKFYDQMRYSLPRFTYYFRNNFRNNLKINQRFSLFYGSLLKNYIKTIVKLIFNKNQFKQKKINSKLFFVEFLESRLDIVLYRAHFAPSVQNARQLISYNHIYVNKKIIKNKFFMLKKGDLIEISPTIFYTIKRNISKSDIWPIPPKYLQINYKTFQIMLTENVKFTNFSLHFSFLLNLNNIIKYHKL